MLPKYPDWSAEAEILTARETLIRVAPDRPEAWYLLGDELFHWGAFLGVEDSRHRASAAFRHALELDSTPYIEPLLHLVAMSGEDGDTAAVRQYGVRVLAADSQGEAAQGIQWLVALKLRDSAALETVRSQMERMSDQALASISQAEMHYGGAAKDAARALAMLQARASSAGSRMVLAWVQGQIAYNAGRPAQGSVEFERTRPVYPRLPEKLVVLGALYWDGDERVAAQIARKLASTADAPLARGTSERHLQYLDMCTVEQWRLWHGQTTTAQRAIRQLRSAARPGDGEEAALVSHVCAVILEAMLVAIERPGGHYELDRLDSLMKTGPSAFLIRLGDQVPLHSANLVIAKIREAQGDLAGALAATRRRGVPQDLYPPTFLTTYLRGEGRLAALTGDTAGAIRAYSQYLQFRSDPEPALKPRVDSVRAELAKLVGERR